MVPFSDKQIFLLLTSYSRGSKEVSSSWTHGRTVELCGHSVFGIWAFGDFFENAFNSCRFYLPMSKKGRFIADVMVCLWCFNECGFLGAEGCHLPASSSTGTGNVCRARQMSAGSVRVCVCHQPQWCPGNLDVEEFCSFQPWEPFLVPCLPWHWCCASPAVVPWKWGCQEGFSRAPQLYETHAFASMTLQPNISSTTFYY